MYFARALLGLGGSMFYLSLIKELGQLFEEKDFFLKDELEKGNYTEHNLISTEKIVMPCLSIETDWEYYELYVCICENGN